MKPYLRTTIVLAILCLPLASRSAHAQAMPNGYGQAISVEIARKIAAAAIAEGKKNGWNVAAAVVDTAGDLVFFERMDAAQVAAVTVSQDKARTAVRFKRSTKIFEDGVANGRHAILGIPGVVPIEGGIPLVIEGKIVGAIGVSGATAPQDGQCAQVAADTLGKQPAPPAPAPPHPPAPPKK
jgi:uncharacterized protein GlcG (DUF336 family)